MPTAASLLLSNSSHYHARETLRSVHRYQNINKINSLTVQSHEASGSLEKGGLAVNLLH